MNKKWLIFVFLIIVVLTLFLQSTNATLQCNIKSSCNSSDTKIIGLENDSGGYYNAHVENASIGSYAYELCCWDDTGFSIDVVCGTKLLGLSSTTNAHAELGNLSNYDYNACINGSHTVSCLYEAGTCSPGYTGVISLASSESEDANMTNAHVANYTVYPQSVCCRTINNAPSLTSVLLNATDDPLNKTSANLTAWPQGVSDSDGDNVHLIYDWRTENISLELFNFNFDVEDSAGSGKTKDYSTYSNNGTLAGDTTDPTWIASAGWNNTGAYEFDGINDYIWIDNSDNIGNEGDFSISLWASKAGITGSHEGMVSKKNLGAGVNSEGWSINLDSNGWYYFTIGNGTYNVRAYKSASISAGYHHFVGTFDESQGLALLYIDGVLGANVSDPDFTFVQSAYDTYIGRSGHFNLLNYNGTIDQVIFFNKTLSTGQVTALFKNQSNVLDSGLTSKGENWSVCLTLNDGFLDGTEVCSYEVEIENSLPSVPTLVIPNDNNSTLITTNITFVWDESIDPDSDAITYDFNLTVNAGLCSVENNSIDLTTNATTVANLCTDQTYNWTVRACDLVGCSAWATQYNFSISGIVSILMISNYTSFGSVSNGEVLNTLDDDPTPIIIENDGNLGVDLDIIALDGLFDNVALDTHFFQYLGNDNETGSINLGLSQTTFAHITAAYTMLVMEFESDDATDTIRLDFNVTVPMNETAGDKSSIIKVRAVQT